MLEAFLADLTLLGLHVDGWLVLGVVAAATLLMAKEKLGPDLVMVSALCVLVVAGVISPRDAMSGFAEPATVTIGVLFVVARAVQETGVLHQVGTFLFGKARTTRAALFRLVVPTAALSAVLNNTPIVALFVPMVTQFARRVGESPSKFLMPLSFATMLGGTCTLIGTSTNLVVSGLVEQQGLPAIGMFELAWVGVPTTIVGVLYLLTGGRALLAERVDPLQRSVADAKAWLAEVEVAKDSPLAGRTVEEAGLRHLPGLFLVEIRRKEQTIRPVAPQSVLAAGDALVFTGIADTIRDLTTLPGLSPTGETPDPGQGLFEVVVSHNSKLVGRNVRASRFRRRFDAAIVAVHRAGERIEGRIGDIVLQAGDTLLLSASPGFADAWRDAADFYLISEVPSDGQPRYRKAPVALLALGMMIALPSLTELTMTVSSMAAFVILLATRCLSPRAARDAVQWPVLLLIGSAFGMSQALLQTGVADMVAQVLMAATQPFGPLALLAGVYLITMTFSLFISNAAAAALIFPIAVAAAEVSGLPVRPFAVTVAMAASAAFATPIGYQTNLMVYGPGGYRYMDFVRVGLPLNALVFLVAMIAIPLAWPLG